MNNIHRLPDTERIEREASDWVARLNAEDVTAEDHAGFQTWRDSHPRHARIYEELSGTWREFRKAGRIARAVSFGDAMNAVANPSKRRYWPGLAAGIAIVGLISILAVRFPSDTQFRTAIGEHATVQLPDGSSLELNSNSLANVEYTESVRVIRLKRGEAYFKVAHESKRPFWVVAGNSWVRAVGTAFNVRYINSLGRTTDVRVIVSEGIVKVATDRTGNDTPSDAALAEVPVSILTAGQQAEVRSGTADIRSLKATELTRSVSWRQGTLNFDNQPLGAAIDEFSRYTNVQIVVENPSLRQLPIGGTFEANREGAEAFLTMLEDGLGLHVRRDGDRRVSIEGEARK